MSGKTAEKQEEKEWSNSFTISVVTGFFALVFLIAWTMKQMTRPVAMLEPGGQHTAAHK